MTEFCVLDLFVCMGFLDLALGLLARSSDYFFFCSLMIQISGRSFRVSIPLISFLVNRLNRTAITLLIGFWASLFCPLGGFLFP